MGSLVAIGSWWQAPIRKHHRSSEMVFPEGSWPAPHREREGGSLLGPHHVLWWNLWDLKERGEGDIENALGFVLIISTGKSGRGFHLLLAPLWTLTSLSPLLAFTWVWECWLIPTDSTALKFTRSQLFHSVPHLKCQLLCNIYVLLSYLLIFW